MQKSRLVLLFFIGTLVVLACSNSDLNKAKEWIMFADKNISVFEYGKKINSDKYLEYFSGLEDKFIGWVLNKVKEDPKF